MNLNIYIYIYLLTYNLPQLGKIKFCTSYDKHSSYIYTKMVTKDKIKDLTRCEVISVQLFHNTICDYRARMIFDTVSFLEEINRKVVVLHNTFDC